MKYNIRGTGSPEIEQSIQLLNIANELSRIADMLEEMNDKGVSVRR